MHVTYDAAVDAAYVYLTDEKLTAGRDSVPVYEGVPGFVKGEVILHFKDGQLVGIEVLGARAVLPADLLGLAR